MRAPRSSSRDVVRYARALHERGWVANHDGNITMRVGPRRFLATPTATSKADVDDKNLLEVDDSGARVSGTSRCFSEINLHLAVYAARSDVNAVVHAHPPKATALACTGRNLIDPPFLPEAIVSLGPSIPLLPFAAPGPAAAEALAAHVDAVDAVLLANHGVLTWGQTVEQAFLRMELVEHLATIALAADPSGGVRPLPEAALQPLLEARAKAGLGKAADDAISRFGKKRVVACSAAPHSQVEVVSKSAKAEAPPASAPASVVFSVRAGVAPEVHRIIREEIVKILSRE